MEYKEILQTKNVWNWKNTCEMVVLHHTATPPWTTKWNLNVLLWNTPRVVSAHYLVNDLWEIYKLAKDEQITYHAWTSSWKWKTDINKYSIWIEIIWPWFTDKQIKSVEELTKYLIEKYWISKDNVVRHKDISPWRKTDVDDTLWNDKFKTFEDYKNYLFNKLEIMWEFAKLKWYKLFDQKEYDKPASIWDVKDLLEVALLRFDEKKNNWTLEER